MSTSGWEPRGALAWVSRGIPTLLVALAMSGLIFALPRVIADPLGGTRALYVVPVALLAARFGWRAGVIAAVLAFAATVIAGRGPANGAGVMWSQAIVFLVAGLGVGLAAERLHGVAEERRRLQVVSRDATVRGELAERVQALTRELSRAATVEEVSGAFAARGVPLLGASHGAVFVLDRNGEYVNEVLSGEQPSRTPSSWRSLRLSSPGVPTDAVRTGEPIFLATAGDIRTAYPGLPQTSDLDGTGAWAAAPLREDDRLIGAVAVGFTDPQPFDEVWRALFLAVAARVQEAIDRAQLLQVAELQRARAEASERRASLLAEVGSLLTAPLQSAERMQRLVQLLVPGFADGATVEAVSAAGTGSAPGSGLELLAAAHAVPALVPVLEQLRRRHFREPADGWGTAALLRQPELRQFRPLGGQVGGQVGGAAQEDGGHIPDELQPGSSIAVPLVARGSVIAVILLINGRARRSFDDADLALAQSIADKAALALDNAQLYERQGEVVSRLQHALLPGAMPQIDGVQAVARYRPATEVLEVGGDWYDVIALPGQRVGVVLGDVVGHGVAAAATMGQLRSAAAAIAPYCSGPAQLLQRLDSFASTVAGAAIATVAYADYEPATGLIRYACAGHPPPLLIDDRGQVRFLQGGRGIPLGMEDLGQPRLQDETSVSPHGTLICYSDGLVERRGIDIDTRLDMLAAAAAELAGRPLPQLCDELLARMVGDGPLRDDIAILCLDLRHRAGRALRYSMPARPSELFHLRAALRPWARSAGLSDNRIDDLVLAANEAASNAIEHAYRDDPGGTRTVDLRADVGLDGMIVIEVADAGRWREQGESQPHRGHGLTLIRATMASVHIGTSDGRTTVTMRMPT